MTKIRQPVRMQARILLLLGATSRRILRVQAPPDLSTSETDDEHFTADLRHAQPLLDRLPSVAGRDVLEIGCGFGGLLTRLEQSGAHPVGIDVDKRRVGYAQSRGLDARLGDAQQLPFSDRSFDVIVSHAVLEHIPSIDRALAEAQRVLRPGGMFFASWGPAWFAYNGPHLVKCLGVPWVNLLFSDRTILEALEQQKRANTWPAAYLDYKIQDFKTMGRLTRRKLRHAARRQGFTVREESSQSPRRFKQNLAQLPLLSELLAGELIVSLTAPT